MPLPPSTYGPGIMPAQQLNTDLYGSPVSGPSGVAFHAQRPLLAETVMIGGTAYSPLSQQPVDAAGLNAYSVIDTTALFARGADGPGANALFRFANYVPASSGAANGLGGNWLTWCFPYTGPVTVPPGAVGAGMVLGSASGFFSSGVLQYGGTVHNQCPWYLDLLAPGAGTANSWKPGFWWLTPSIPSVIGSDTDTAGEVTRMGWLWTGVTTGGGTVPSVPSVPSSWGTVTSAALNAMGSALTLLNNPPALRATSTAGQSLTSGATTVLQFGTPTVDTYAGWGTSLSRYAVPLPGLYLFCPTAVWGTASSSGDRWCGITSLAGGSSATYQGAAYKATPVGPGTTGTGLTATAVARILSLNAGDEVQAYGVQNSGAALSLYTGLGTRIIGAYMTPQAPAGGTVSYTAPVTGFRFQAGMLAGTALADTLAARIGNDVNFLLGRPYFTGWQATSQNGFANNSGFHQVTIDTLGALPRGGNGDNWGGWSASNHRYVSQLAGWYLVIADLYATPPSATTATLTAGIFCSSSGGITPTSTPDWYQQVFYPVSTGGPPPGAFAMGCYYLLPGEYVLPMMQAQDWGGTWGTYAASASSGIVNSQFSAFWVSELREGRGDGLGSWVDRCPGCPGRRGRDRHRVDHAVHMAHCAPGRPLPRRLRRAAGTRRAPGRAGIHGPARVGGTDPQRHRRRNAAQRRPVAARRRPPYRGRRRADESQPGATARPGGDPAEPA